MTRSLIYIIAIFALWLYFKYGNFSTEPMYHGGSGSSNPGAGAGRK